MPPETPTLAEIQRLMAHAIMRPLTRQDRMQRRWDDGTPASGRIDSLIKRNSRLSAFERLEIYNRQYWFRLLDCLYEDYPGLRAILGGARFMRLITAYLQRYPSTSPILRDLGRLLPDFISEEPQHTTPHQLLARDMASLEWAQIVAFDAASRRPLSFRRLRDQPPDQIVLGLQPHISLLRLSYPVDETLLRVLRQEGQLRTETSNAVESLTHPLRRSIARHIPPRSTWLLVHRQHNSVFFKRLSEPEFLILDALRHGADLATACSTPASSSPTHILAPAQLQAWFQTWSALGIFTAPPRPDKAKPIPITRS